ncbi:phage tail protein [Ruminiclostridium josui]|uniref:phage tail protein n=2 Tax=Ruminiclostridium josui TaxID=1499 RepID=UPI000463C85E|nr:hypothetical protein [Ruminiclostridium josui]
MAAGKRELQALITLAGKIDPSLRKALRMAQGETTKLSKSAEKSGSSLSNTGSIIKGVFAGNLISGAVSKIGTKILELGKEGIQLASDLSEVQNVVDTTFGGSAKEINKFAQTALNSFGLSELQAKQFNGTLGAMLKSSGITGDSLVTMSEKLTGLSGDISSFYNVSQEDAFEKIRAGISGETEPLKQLGINMSVANMEAFALSKGIKASYSKMDQASQTALRYAYLMNVSKDAQGDFAKTQGGYANQMRLLQTNIKQLTARMASGLIPYLAKGAQYANNFVSKLGKMNISFAGVGSITKKVFPEIKKQMNFFKSEGVKIFDGLGPSAMKLGQSVLPFVSKSFNTYTGKVLPIVKRIVSGFVDIMVPNISKAFDFIRTAVLPPAMKVISFFADTIIPKVGNIVSMWMPKIQAVIGSAFNLAILLAGKVMAAFNTYWPYISQLVTIAVDTIGGVVSGLLTTLSGVIDFITGVFSGNWSLAWQGVKDIFVGIFSSIGSVLKGVINVIIAMINNGIRGVNKLINVKAPDWVPGIGGKSLGFTIPEIDTFAQGGFANQPSIFGEAGLEAAIPIKYKNPRSLSLLNKTARALGADQGGGQQISLTYAPVINGGNKAEIQALLDTDKEKFFAWLNEYFEDRERVSFA